MTRIEIPLKFRKNPEWPNPAHPPALIYDSEPHASASGGKVQPVLAGRRVLRPRLDLDSYIARAVIDWVEIWLTTPGEHQAGNMYKFIRRVLDETGGATSVFVSGPNREKRYKGRFFVLKFHDPAPGAFRQVLQDTVERYAGDTSSIDALAIAGIEISVDFYVRKSLGLRDDERDLRRWQMLDLLRRHLRPEPVLTEEDYCHPRTYGSEYGGNGASFVVKTRASSVSGDLVRHFTRVDVDERHRPVLQLSAHNQPPVDQTHWIGARDSIVLLRSMDKITDRRDPETDEAVTLSPEDCRARLEVTLQGAPDRVGGHGAVNMKTVGDLYGFKFEGIRKPFFEFFLPTLGSASDTESLPFPARVTEQEVFRRSGVYGLDRLHRAIEAVNHAAYKRDEIADNRGFVVFLMDRETRPDFLDLGD